jgi:hypothetical protein
VADAGILKELGLARNIEALAHAYLGRGMVQQRIGQNLAGEEINQRPQATREKYIRITLSSAHNFAIAAAAYALFDASRAKYVYGLAALSFIVARAPSGAALIPCSGSRSINVDWKTLEPLAPTSAEDALGWLLYDAWLHASERRSDTPAWLSSRAKEFDGARVGAAGVPFGLFAEFHRNMLDFAPSGEFASNIIESVVALLERYAEVVDLARSDSYHWERLQTRILPVPHEILATTLCLLAAARTDVESEIRERLRNKTALVPLMMARNMLAESPTESAEMAHPGEIVETTDEPRNDEHEPPPTARA